jgi:glycosyltransferase involved in cell wall biosynthesis
MLYFRRRRRRAIMNAEKPICFVAGDQRFLFRHFGPAIAAAKARDAEVIAFVPGGGEAEGHASAGVRIIPCPTIRAVNSPLAIIAEAIWFGATLRRIQPCVVVVYSLRMCLVIALAQFFVKSCRFVFAVTGVGFLGIWDSIKARIVRLVVFRAISWVPRRRSHFIFENAADPVSTGIARSGHSFSILMGAGVHLHEFRKRDVPRGRPFRFATMSRLVWSKGIDIAVQAISTLAQEGHPVELHIHGAPDFSNPRPVDPNSLRNIPGVHYHGFSDSIADLWESYHAAIFTSRGGEGLPRALLEAAASGRPSIVTDVPGCRDFVRDGIDGYVVALESDAALRSAILKLMSASEQNLKLLGDRARERVRATSTTAHIQDRYSEIFHSLLQQGPATAAPRNREGVKQLAVDPAAIIPARRRGQAL